MTQPRTHKTIGALNGPWALLLKLFLASFLPLMSFLVVNQILDNQFRGEGDRFTEQDAERMIKVLTQDREIRINRMEDTLKNLISPVAEVGPLNNKVSRVEILLETIQKDLDAVKKNVTHN